MRQLSKSPSFNIATTALYSLLCIGLLAGCGKTINDKDQRATESAMPRKSLIGECVDMPSEYISPSVLSDEGVRYDIRSVVTYDQVLELYEMGDPDDDKYWLIVMISISNLSDETISLNSDNFDIISYGLEWSEDGSESGQLNMVLDTKDMGNFLGTDLEVGDSELFAMPYQVEMESTYRFRIKDEDLIIPLNDVISFCLGTKDYLAQSEATPAPPPTEVPTATRPPESTSEPTSSPKPTDPNQKTPKPRSTTAPATDVLIPPSTNLQTLMVMNDLDRYHNTQVWIRGEVYTMGDVNGQTVIVLTDQETYFFNVIFDGPLPGIEVGDVVKVDGILLDRTLNGSPLVQANGVVED